MMLEFLDEDRTFFVLWRGSEIFRLSHTEATFVVVALALGILFAIFVVTAVSLLMR